MLMDEDFINALLYGFLGALGVMLLNTPSPTVILSSSWMGLLLLAWGMVTLILTIIEKASTSNEYQEVITITLFLIMTGYVIASYGIDILKIAGATLLSIVIGRAFALLINFL